MTRKIIAVIFVFVLLLCVTNNHECQARWICEVAHAESGTVTTTGNVNLRSGPSLDCETIKSVSSGTQLEYAGETSVDSRGVSWYKVVISGYGSAWVSSKYAELQVLESVSTAEAISEYASSEQDIPEGVLSREDIIRRYGVFNFNELINTTDVQANQSGDVQTFTVYFEDAVYWGGSEGYGSDWMATNGIAAELLCDLDGDGADEYTIFYVRSEEKYGGEYIENQWTASIFEPVSGGYVFADSFEFNFDWTSDGGETSILLLNSEKGMRIVYGSVGYWDGGNGGIYGTFYGYDGSSVYVDLVFDTETASSAYILAGRIDEDQLEQAIAFCGEYQYSDEIPADDFIENARLFFPNRTSDEFGTLYDYGYDPPRMQMEYMNCIEIAAEMAAEYGCEMGYKIDGNSYELYLKGGQVILWRSEDYRNDQDCIDLKFYSTLAHFIGTDNANTVMLETDTETLYCVENPLSSGMIDLADGTIVNVQQDIQVNLKLREYAGIFYINFYQVNGTEEEWIYGDEIYRSSAQHYFLIPANLFTDANYRIDVDAWIGIGGHNDEMITRESVYFHTVTEECTHQWVSADSPLPDTDSISAQHPNHELHQRCQLCGETKTILSIFDANCCCCTGAHVWKQPTSVFDATTKHPAHTVYCIYCGTGNDMNFDASCMECGAKEALWYCEFAQLAYNTDRYSDVHAVLPENCIRIDVQREETNIDKNKIVAPDCLIYTTVDSNGTLSVAFAFEGSQGNPYQLLYDEDGDHESLEGWNDWWLTDFAVGKDERGIHRGFSEAVETFIRYLEENTCIPIPDSFADQFSKDELARNADGQLCVSWDGLLDYAHTHINETEIRITGHSLGGALAQVFTYDLLTDYGFTKNQITTYTFASPVPFSDEAIASTLYDNLKVFNYINIHDFVPKYGVTNNTNSALSFFETTWNEISNAAGFTDSSFPGGFVAAGSNLGYNIYMDGTRQSHILAEHALSTYTELLNDFFGSGDVKCYAIDTRDSALWDYIKEK